MNQEKQSYITLNESNFHNEVLNSTKPVLVDFWAPWCGPCQVMGPVVNELAEEFQSRAVVAKMNVDDNQNMASRYDILSIPTLMIFRNGEVVDKMVGTMSKTALTQKLEDVLQAA